MLLDQFRTHRLTVERRDRVTDGEHGWTEAFGPVGTVEGSLQPLQQSSGMDVGPVGDQMRAEVRWRVLLDPAADVQRDDQLTLTHRRVNGAWTAATAPAPWRVLAILDHHGDGPVDHVDVVLEEVQSGT